MNGGEPCSVAMHWVKPKLLHVEGFARLVDSSWDGWILTLTKGQQECGSAAIQLVDGLASLAASCLKHSVPESKLCLQGTVITLQARPLWVRGRSVGGGKWCRQA